MEGRAEIVEMRMKITVGPPYTQGRDSEGRDREGKARRRNRGLKYERHRPLNSATREMRWWVRCKMDDVEVQFRVEAG